MGARRKKLLTVARLWLLSPEKFGRTCQDCRLYVYDEHSGKRSENRDGSGPQLRRKLMGDPPCHDCGKTIGCQPRHWSQAADPPVWCYRTFRHWRTMEAVRWSSGTVDKIVRRNAGLFAAIRDAVDRDRSSGIVELLGIGKR